jgi:hypothetical protein
MRVAWERKSLSIGCGMGNLGEKELVMKLSYWSFTLLTEEKHVPVLKTGFQGRSSF